MRRATIYRRRHTYFVHPTSLTTEGIGILSEPCIAIPEAHGDPELGDAILRALDASAENVPHPDQRSWAKVPEPLLKLAGAKSWNKFAAGATCAEIEEDDNWIVVVPTRNLGPEGGFEHDIKRKSLVKRGEVSQLGIVARKVLGEP